MVMIRVNCKWEDLSTGKVLHEILTFETIEDAERFIHENKYSRDKNDHPRVIREAKIINGKKLLEPF